MKEVLTEPLWALKPAADAGWNASSWVTIIGSVVTFVGVCITGYLTYRASVKSNREKVAADERAAEREAEKEEREAAIRRQELQDETIAQLRQHLEGIIARLTEEVEYTRQIAQRLREQVNEEQGISDTLRARVRDLEDQVHELSQTIADLRRRMIVDDAEHAFDSPPPVSAHPHGGGDVPV